MVLKGLISDETNAMKNRITVIPETFQKSIYYLLLRGKPVKDKNQKPHFNLSKALSAIIKLSDRFLRKQARMPAPAAEQEADQHIEVSSENGTFFHGHLVNLSICCLIELCNFIDSHVHTRGKKTRKPAQSEP